MANSEDGFLQKGQEEVEKWATRIEITRKATQENFAKKAKRNIEYYIGNQFPEDEAFDESRVPINFIASVVDSLVPAVYTKNPRVRVTPAVPDVGDKEVNRKRRDFASMQQALINKTLLEIKFKKTAKAAIKDGTLTSRGIIKYGFSAQLGKRKGTKYVFDAVRKFIPGVPIDENIQDTFVKKQRVWAERVSPFKFFYDLDANDLEHATWCAQEITLPLHRVRNNPIYNKKIRKMLQPSGVMGRNFMSKIWDDIDAEHAEVSEFPEDVQRITLYEIWDKESRRVRVLARGNEDLGFLRDDPWPFKSHEGFPFKEYISITVPDSQWSTSEVDRIIEGQDEMNVIRDMMFKHTRRSMAGWAITRGAMDEEDLNAWREGEILESFFIRNVNDIKSLIPPQMPTAYFEYARTVKEDLGENSKLPSWRRAGEKLGVRTAAEVNEITQGLDVITNEKVDVVMDFILDIVKGLSQIMQEKYTLSQVVPVVGLHAESWREFTPAEIKEELDIKLVPFSAIPINPNQELVHYREFLSIIVQVQQAGVPVNLLSFLRTYAEKLQIHDFDDYLGPESLRVAGEDEGIQAQLAQGLQGLGGQQGAPGQSGGQLGQGVVGR